jgi:hypothetical protein
MKKNAHSQVNFRDWRHKKENDADNSIKGLGKNDASKNGQIFFRALFNFLSDPAFGTLSLSLSRSFVYFSPLK